jgi:outer membrane protein TolC
MDKPVFADIQIPAARPTIPIVGLSFHQILLELVVIREGVNGALYFSFHLGQCWCASLRVPLFDGGRIEADRAQTLSLVRQEQIRDKEFRNHVELEIRQALATLASAKSQVQVAEQAVALAEDEIARARRRYEAGVTNSVEVVEAETRLENARDDRVAALFNSTDASIDLAEAMGTIRTISF